MNSNCALRRECRIAPAAKHSVVLPTLFFRWAIEMLVISRLSLLSWAAVTIKTQAHPLFDGIIVQRAENLSETYDYVVVGAGASGLTVANRLSEDPCMILLV